MSDIKQFQQKSLFGYELTTKQYILVNYLLPSIGSCILYILIIACDTGVVYRHYKEEDPLCVIWSALTLFFMYLPAIGSYIVIMTSLELWPEKEGFGLSNIIWAVVKTLEHALFPVWSMWRYAERIFWGIEGTTTTDEADRSKIQIILDAPRSIELYVFLQSYLHSLPQSLIQTFILIRHEKDINMETVGAELASTLLNLLKVAATTAYFQRFKTQKLAGKNYPWFKPYKQVYDTTIDSTKKPLNEEEEATPQPSSSQENPDEVVLREKSPDGEPSKRLNRSTLRRSSSDFYLQPTSSFEGNQGFIQKHIVEPVKHFNKTYVLRETSVVDGPQRMVLHEPDFNIRRLKDIKGLPEDDFAGKMVAVCWWYCFLLARVLAITAFFYFYQKPCFWILFAHFVLVIAFLLYDVQTGEVKRNKIIFFLFIGFVYLFCVIEFKIKFKKAKFIYYGFFTLVYVENLIMCLVWWFSDLETLQEDFWFRYVFVIIVMTSIFSLTAMLFYLNINKPKKIVVDTVPAEP